MSRWKKWLIGIGLTLTVIVAGLVGATVWLIQYSTIPRQEVIAGLRDRLGLEATLATGRLHWDGRFLATDVVISLPDGTRFIEAAEVELQFPPALALVWGAEPDVAWVRFDEAVIYLRRDASGSWRAVEHFETVAAESGTEAEASLEQTVELYDTDVVVEGMDGVERRLESVTLSMRPGEAGVTRLEMLGMDRFLVSVELRDAEPVHASVAGSRLEQIADLAGVASGRLETMDGQIIWERADSGGTPDGAGEAAEAFWEGSLQGDLNATVTGDEGPVSLRLATSQMRVSPSEVAGSLQVVLESERLQAQGVLDFERAGQRVQIDPENLQISARADRTRTVRVTGGTVRISGEGVQFTDVVGEGLGGRVRVDAWWPLDADVVAIDPNVTVVHTDFPSDQTVDVVEKAFGEAVADEDLDGPRPVWAPAEIDLPWHAIRGSIEVAGVDVRDLAAFVPELAQLTGAVSGVIEWDPTADRLYGEQVIRARIGLRGDDLAYRTIAFSSLHATAYLGHDHIALPQARVRLADGHVDINGLITRDGNDTTLRAQSEVTRLDYGQLIRSWDEKTKQAAGRLTADVRIEGPVDQIETLAGYSGTGQVWMTESNFADTEIFGALYRVLSLKLPAAGNEGYGQAQLHLEGPMLAFDRVRYFNKGAAIYLQGEITDLPSGADSPLSGTAFGAAEPLDRIPLIGDIAALVGRLQSLATAVKISGTVDDPQVKSIPLKAAVSIFKTLIDGFKGPMTVPDRARPATPPTHSPKPS